jgi:isoleucyl-tRNA synthetase
VSFISDTESLYVPKLVLDIRAAGPVLRGDWGKVKALVAETSPEVMASMVKDFDLGRPCRIAGHEADLPPSIFTKEKGMAPGLEVVEDGEFTLALDLTIDEALEQEGLARDVVRHLQVLRKEAGLEVTQRIELELSTTSPKLQKAISRHKTHIMEELLAIKLQEDGLKDPTAKKELDICGHPLAAALRGVRS